MSLRRWLGSGRGAEKVKLVAAANFCQATICICLSHSEQIALRIRPVLCLSVCLSGATSLHPCDRHFVTNKLWVFVSYFSGSVCLSVCSQCPHSSICLTSGDTCFQSRFGSAFDTMPVALQLIYAEQTCSRIPDKCARAPLCACINVLLITCVGTIRQRKICFSLCLLARFLSSCSLLPPPLPFIPGGPLVLRLTSRGYWAYLHVLNFQAGYLSARHCLLRQLRRACPMRHRMYNLWPSTESTHVCTHTHAHIQTHG